MKKIIFSLAIIGAIGAIVAGATTAYFSDTETSTGNTFTAGTVDISIDGQNPWSDTFTLDDMKPGYTDYINFDIQNDGSGANPVNVWKNIKVTDEETGVVTEPECTEQNGDWNSSNGTCDFGDSSDNNNLSSVIVYDLYVEVYNSNNEKVWYQTIYADNQNQTLDDVYGVNGDGEVFLGMIPAGGHMKVTQSYHMDESAGNEFQGDEMTFDIDIKAEQLHGTAWLDNKDTSSNPWLIVHNDDFNGALTYKVKNPTFDFSFNGKVALPSTTYVLAAGYDSGTNVDTYLGEGTSDGSGNISFSGNIELNKNLKNYAKVWLMPETNWNSGNIAWSQMDKWLWETGMIWYEDTDL